MEVAPPVRLHPNLAQVYRRQVERLQDTLNEPEIRDEAIEVLRGLVERVIIGPDDNGLEVEGLEGCSCCRLLAYDFWF
jgi:site-specific DNA recombinase